MAKIDYDEYTSTDKDGNVSEPARVHIVTADTQDEDFRTYEGFRSGNVGDAFVAYDNGYHDYLPESVWSGLAWDKVTDTAVNSAADVDTNDADGVHTPESDNVIVGDPVQITPVESDQSDNPADPVAPTPAETTTPAPVEGENGVTTSD